MIELQTIDKNDMSKGQVYFEDVINKLNELGFKIC